MKKRLFALLLVFFVLLPVFAANEYYQVGFNGGYSDAMKAPYIGLHSQYQFGASFSESFDFGFGSYADLDFALNEKSSNNIAFSLAFGPAFALQETELVTSNFMIGPEIRGFQKYDSKKNESWEAFGVGVGASFAYTLTPPAEQNARVQLGFTAGVMGSLFWLEENKMNTSVKGFIGMTLKGPLLFIDGDLYDDIVWYGLNM